MNARRHHPRPRLDRHANFHVLIGAQAVVVEPLALEIVFGNRDLPPGSRPLNWPPTLKRFRSA